MEARYIVDENGKRVGVILDVEEYERMVEELEELEDVLAYDRAKAEIEREEDELIPFEQAVREIEEGRVPEDGA
jgi:PHD/YefM family antitoxin component YafN of YafNO toxin-antitoxin module